MLQEGRAASPGRRALAVILAIIGFLAIIAGILT